jgi:hypothetical protein
MKKILLTLLLLCIALPTYAQKQEWFDSTYDFTKAKSIAFCVYIDNRMPELTAKEIVDIYYESIKTGIYDKLNKSHKIVSLQKLKKDFQATHNKTEEELIELAKSDPEKVDKMYFDYVNNNYDLYVVATPIIYDMGTQYREGYTYTLPSINQSLITFPNGQIATVTSNGQTVHTMPGGNFPTVYVSFRFDIIDAKTLGSNEKTVWARLDDRARVNQDILQNSRPKDVFKRMMGSFADDFVKVINSKKATKSKSKDYGF